MDFTYIYTLANRLWKLWRCSIEVKKANYRTNWKFDFYIELEKYKEQNKLLQQEKELLERQIGVTSGGTLENFGLQALEELEKRLKETLARVSLQIEKVIQSKAS